MSIMARLTDLVPGIALCTAPFCTTVSTVVTGNDGSCLVIDPAVTVTEVAALAADLAERGLRPAAGFATHPHWDHVLWSRELGDVPRYATPAAVEAARARRDRIITQTREFAPGHDPALIADLTPLTGASIEWDGPAAQVIAHNAHAPGHAGVFLPAAGVLLAGDMLSDVEIPLLDPRGADPVGDYRAGLDALAAAGGVEWIVPGHGHPGDAAEFRRRLDADYRYIDNLASGASFADPRLDGADDWLRESHEANLTLAASR
jgi:hydroxyacylglutathione hydrolase